MGRSQQKKSAAVGERNRVRTSALIAAAAASVGLVILLATASAEAQLTREQQEATNRIREMVEAGLDADSGDQEFRIHMFNEVLDQGTEVRPFHIETLDFKPLECANRCLLFYVDLYPIAHYGHPVIIALWDLDLQTDSADERIQSLDAEWWPVIEKPGPPGSKGTDQRSIFRSVISRV